MGRMPRCMGYAWGHAIISSRTVRNDVNGAALGVCAAVLFAVDLQVVVGASAAGAYLDVEGDNLPCTHAHARTCIHMCRASRNAHRVGANYV